MAPFRFCAGSSTRSRGRRQVGAPGSHKENLGVLDFRLTDEEMARIAALDTGESLFFGHRDPAMVTAIGTRRIHD